MILFKYIILYIIYTNTIARITLLRRNRGNEPLKLLLYELCKYIIIYDREKVVDNMMM